MSQSLKEINGKHYKECQVVMLQAKSIEQITFVKHTQGKYHNKLQMPFAGGEYRRLLNYGFEPQHLYFLSSDEGIKEGDWVYKSNSDKTITQLDSFGKHLYDIGSSDDGYKKIIATTDSSLKVIMPNPAVWDIGIKGMPLPQPSPEFIQAYVDAYNSGKPILRIFVEYEKI